MRENGLRLQSEWEQAEAHSRRWQERSAGHYGHILLYELGDDDASIAYELTEYNGRPALLMGHDERLHVILVPPDVEYPWRRSSPGHVEEHGRRISVREALDYVGVNHRAWTIEQTAVALGETLMASAQSKRAHSRGANPSRWLN